MEQDVANTTEETPAEATKSVLCKLKMLKQRQGESKGNFEELEAVGKKKSFLGQTMYGQQSQKMCISYKRRLALTALDVVEFWVTPGIE